MNIGLKIIVLFNFIKFIFKYTSSNIPEHKTKKGFQKISEVVGILKNSWIVKFVLGTIVINTKYIFTVLHKKN